MGWSSTLRTDVLDYAMRGKAHDFSYTPIYVSLHTSDPGDTGAGEVSGGSYARQQASWNAATDPTITTAADVEYTDMPDVTVTHVGLWDSDSAGTFLGEGPLDQNKDVDAGDTVLIQAGDLDVELVDQDN